MTSGWHPPAWLLCVRRLGRLPQRNAPVQRLVGWLGGVAAFSVASTAGVVEVSLPSQLRPTPNKACCGGRGASSCAINKVGASCTGPARLPRGQPVHQHLAGLGRSRKCRKRGLFFCWVGSKPRRRCTGSSGSVETRWLRVALLSAKSIFL